MIDTSTVSAGQPPAPPPVSTPSPSPSASSNYQPIDIVAALKDGMNNLKEGIRSAVGLGSGAVSSANSSASAAKEATVTEAKAQGQIANIQATRDLQLKADDAATDANLGMQPGAASWLAANVRDNVLPKQIQTQKDQDELEAMKKVGFLDDPIQHVINSFLIPFKEGALKQEQSDIDQRLGVTSAITSLDTAIKANNATSDVVDATAKAKALSDEAVAQAVQKQAEITDRASALQISGAQLSLQATTQGVDTAFKFLDAQFMQRRDGYEALQADANAAYKNAAASADQLRVKLESENDADKQAAFQQIQKAANDKAGIVIPSYNAFKLMGTAQKDTLLTMAGNSTITTAIDPLSTTKSIDMLGNLGSGGPSPGVQYVINKAKDIAAPVDTNTLYLALKQEDKIPLKDQRISDATKQELQNIPTTGGFYSPFTFDKTANINPTISALPLIKEMVAGGLGKDGTTPTNPDDFMATGLAQVNRGVPVSDVAAQIAYTFKSVAGNLQQVRNYGLVNVTGLAPSQPYNMTVHAPPDIQSMRGYASLPKIIDVSNVAAVQNYLTRLAAMKKTGNLQPTTGAGLHTPQ